MSGDIEHSEGYFAAVQDVGCMLIDMAREYDDPASETIRRCVDAGAMTEEARPFVATFIRAAIKHIVSGHHLKSRHDVRLAIELLAFFSMEACGDAEPRH